MPDCCAAVSQQTAEVNSLNSKLGYDFAAQLQNQALIDNQAHARASQNLQIQAAQDAQTIKQLALTGLLQVAQTGATENQQTVDPFSTASADAIKGGVGVAAEQVAANVAALSDVTVKLSELVLALIAQVQPKG
jgi:hypothetical protein